MTDVERFRAGLFIGFGFGGLALIVAGAGFELERVAVGGFVLWSAAIAIALDSIRRDGLAI